MSQHITPRMRPARASEAPRDRRETGSALLITMLLLALMGILGLSSLNTVMRDRQVAGFQNQAQSALYAADAGIAEGLGLLRAEVLGQAVSVGDCLANNVSNTTLSNGASYAPDGGGGICMLAVANPCEELDSSDEVSAGGGFFNMIWSVEVQGQSPGGATSRLQTGVERCHVFTYNY